MTLIGNHFRHSIRDPSREWVAEVAQESRYVKRAAHGGPMSIEVNSAIGYFFGVSTGVGTLSMTEDEPRRLVI